MTTNSETPVDRAGPIPFIDLATQRRRLGERLDQAVLHVLAHGRYILGPEVVDLERRLKTFSVRHALGCANGTDALALGLLARGIGPGDAVLVPAFTFVATAEVVAWTGAAPVFLDVLPDTFNLDPGTLEAGLAIARRQGLTPRAVIAVDLFGQPADYDRLGRDRPGAGGPRAGVPLPAARLRVLLAPRAPGHVRRDRRGEGHLRGDQGEILELARALPFLPYVGWDVIPTDDAFVIIECNNRSNVNVMQVYTARCWPTSACCGSTGATGWPRAATRRGATGGGALTTPPGPARGDVTGPGAGAIYPSSGGWRGFRGWCRGRHA